MNPIRALRENLVNFSFDSRSGRVDWWATRLFLGFASGLVANWVIVSGMSPLSASTVLGIWFLYVMLIDMAVSVRRLHDLDKPSWLIGVPFVGFAVGLLPVAVSLPFIIQGLVDAGASLAGSSMTDPGEISKAMTLVIARDLKEVYTADILGSIGIIGVMFGTSAQLVLLLILGFARGTEGLNILGMRRLPRQGGRSGTGRRIVDPEMEEKRTRMMRAREIDAERMAREAALQGH